MASISVSLPISWGSCLLGTRLSAASVMNGELATSSSQSMTSLWLCLLGVSHSFANDIFSLRMAVNGVRMLICPSPSDESGLAMICDSLLWIA